MKKRKNFHRNGNSPTKIKENSRFQLQFQFLLRSEFQFSHPIALPRQSHKIKSNSQKIFQFPIFAFELWSPRMETWCFVSSTKRPVKYFNSTPPFFPAIFDCEAVSMADVLLAVPAAVLRNLADKLYEKRKNAALEVSLLNLLLLLLFAIW